MRQQRWLVPEVGLVYVYEFPHRHINNCSLPPESFDGNNKGPVGSSIEGA